MFKGSTLSPSDRSWASAFQVPSKLFSFISGACPPSGVPTVKSVLSGFSEFYPDGIPAIAERGIENLYQKYAKFSRRNIGKYVQSNALPVWASKNALNHMHQGRIIDTYHAHLFTTVGLVPFVRGNALVYLPRSIWVVTRPSFEIDYESCIVWQDNLFLAWRDLFLEQASHKCWAFLFLEFLQQTYNLNWWM